MFQVQTEHAPRRWYRNSRPLLWPAPQRREGAQNHSSDLCLQVEARHCNRCAVIWENSTDAGTRHGHTQRAISRRRRRSWQRHGSRRGAAHFATSLSQAIRNLERTLGSALFDRTARGLIPTAAGAAVADAARKLLTDVAKAETAVAAVIALQSGELAIAVQSDLAVDAVADMAGQLHRTAPGIVFSTTAASSAREVRALVRSGRCELGFLERDLADGTSDNLREIETRAQETVLSIPPALAVGLPIRCPARRSVPCP